MSASLGPTLSAILTFISVASTHASPMQAPPQKTTCLFFHATGVSGPAESCFCCYFHGANKHLLPLLAVVPKPGATVQTVEAARLSARGLSQRSRATID